MSIVTKIAKCAQCGKSISVEYDPTDIYTDENDYCSPDCEQEFWDAIEEGTDIQKPQSGELS